MYVPAQYRVDDPETIKTFLQEHAFAALCTNVEGVPFVTHVPFLIDFDGPQLRLTGHMARANPQWRSFDQTALIMFTGPHAYTSPRHYRSAESVPTWNYTAIHVYGEAATIDDEASVMDVLRRSVRREESAYAQPWAMETLPDAYLQSMVAGIVAFRVVVERIEAKFKLSQNRPEDDRTRVAAALSSASSELSRALGRMMLSEAEGRSQQGRSHPPA